jgi:hypothetical protein
MNNLVIGSDGFVGRSFCSSSDDENHKRAGCGLGGEK